MNYSVLVEPSTNSLVVDANPDILVQVMDHIPEVTVATPGIQGKRGYSTLSGSGRPEDSLGINNDLYVNLDNGFLYKKIEYSWVYQSYLYPQSKRIYIQEEDIDNKYIILDPIPNNPDNVTMRFLTGCDQENGVEFKVMGNILSWASNPEEGVEGLEGFISDGDIIIVQY